MTCDNGISAADQIAFAKKMGMTVVVTDHHEVPFEDTEEGRKYKLPLADAIINPKQSDCTYPNKNICGAVVAMKLVFALYEKYGIPESEKEDYLEPAAIATVGDIMDLQGENRILVKEGLLRLPHTKNKGLKALIRAIGLENQKISSYDIGFRLGPCINASGRLDTAMRSLSLLQCEDEEEAAKLANDLKALNDSRKALTEQGTEAAYKLIEGSNLKNDRVMVVFLPDCHESLAGIIAGRIREKYHKPAFVLTRGEKSVKGSGRSTENYSMYEELVKCDSLLLQYGGHPMAAGLSIEEANVEAFRRQLNENCTLTEEDMIPKNRDRCTNAHFLHKRESDPSALCSGTLWKRKCEACFCPEKSPRFKNRNIWKDSEYSEIAADGRIRHGDGWGLLGRGKGVCRVCKVSWNYFCNLLSEDQLLYGKRLFANCHTKLLLKRG